MPPCDPSPRAPVSNLQRFACCLSYVARQLGPSLSEPSGGGYLVRLVMAAAFDAVEVVPQAGEHERNLPAPRSDIRFAHVEEVSEPAFRSNGRFHFRKRAIGERIHETRGRREQSPRGLPLPTLARAPQPSWRTNAFWPSRNPRKRRET